MLVYTYFIHFFLGDAFLCIPRLTLTDECSCPFKLSLPLRLQFAATRLGIP